MGGSLVLPTALLFFAAASATLARRSCLISTSVNRKRQRHNKKNWRFVSHAGSSISIDPNMLLIKGKIMMSSGEFRRRRRRILINARVVVYARQNHVIQCQ